MLPEVTKRLANPCGEQGVAEVWDELPLPARAWVHESRDSVLMACGFPVDHLTFENL